MASNTQVEQLKPRSTLNSTRRGRSLYALSRLAWAGLDLLYPPYCSGCGKPGARWCPTCQANARRITPPVCERCGKSQPGGGVCLTCQEHPPVFVALRTWAVFDGTLRLALHRLKYEGDMALGEVLAQHLAEVLCTTGWPVDLVVPTPMGRARRKQRGYNQAALLAWPLAAECSLAYQSKALQKVRETRSQVGLNFDERHDNVAGAFQADARLAAGKTVLVIDDVTTSGATLQECSLALMAAGAKAVYGLTLARAVHTPDQNG